MRIIIDCNIFISAGIGSKNCINVIKLIDNIDTLKLHLSKDIITEFVSVSRRKKFDKYIQNMLELTGDLIAISKKHKNIPISKNYIITDKKDQMYIDLAEYINCDYLVTGNTKHFPHTPYGNTKIVTPKQFLNIFL